MKPLKHAMMLVFAGVVIGAVHSYCAPIQLKPANNPEPAPGATGTGAEPEPAGAGPIATDIKPADGVSGGTPTGSPNVDPPQAEPTESDPPPAAPNYFITLERAKELFDKGQADGTVFFVDARPMADYQKGHVTGATYLPPGFGGIYAKKAKEYFPGQTVVVYCHGATCTDSEEVMIGLQNLKTGIGPIYILKDGFDAWRARGWPVDNGPDPLQ